jgi:biopolymer transport protein ExbD
VFGEGGLARKKKSEEADLDITPMIDVTFLLLIFFMVTSTMQGTPDKDIPPSASGTNANAAGFLDLTVAAPTSSGSDGKISLDGVPVNLEQLKAELKKEAAGGREVSLMIYAERDVKSGFIGEIEGVISEVAKEEEATIEMKYAVRDRR